MQNWLYEFDNPALDTRFPHEGQPKGTFSSLVGVDGRYRGRLRRFPGFKVHATIGTTAVKFGTTSTAQSFTFGTKKGVKLFKSFAIQRGPNEAALIRGVLFAARDTTLNADVIVAHFFDTSTGGGIKTMVLWVGVLVAQEIDSIDVTWDHRHFFIMGQSSESGGANVTSINDMARYTGTIWTKWNMSPDLNAGLNDTHDASPVGASSSGKDFLLRGQTYGLAFRIICPEQDVYGPLSEIFLHEVPSGAEQYAWQRIALPAVPWATRRYLEMFRSVGSGYADIASVGSLHLDSRVDIGTGVLVGNSGSSWTWGLPPSEAGLPPQATNAVGGLADTALLLRGANLDPIETKVFGTLPPAKMAQAYEGLLVAVTLPDASENATDTEVIRWTPLIQDRMNLFPVDHRKRPRNLSDQVSSLVVADPYLAIITDSAIYRMHRSGTQLSFDPQVNRQGGTGRWAPTALGTMLFVPTDLGLLMVDLVSGAVEGVLAAQRIFDDPARWRGTLSDVYSGYDSEAGCIVFHHRVKHETLLLWVAEGVLTELEDAPFDAIAEGVPASAGGGAQLAFFLQESSRRVYVIDAAGDAATQTMNGGSSGHAYNGVITVRSSNDVTLWVDTQYGTLPDDNEMDGFYIHFHELDVDGSVVTGVTGERRLVLNTDLAASRINLTTALTEDAVGCRYSIAAVPFKARMWPLWDPAADEGTREPFRLKKCVAAGMVIRKLTGDYESSSANLRTKLFRLDTTTTVAEAAHALSTSPQRTFTKLLANGTILVPEVSSLVSNVGFDLHAVALAGTVEENILASLGA